MVQRTSVRRLYPQTCRRVIASCGLAALGAIAAAQSYTVTPLVPYVGVTQGNAKFRVNEVGQVACAALNPANGIFGGCIWSPSTPNGTVGTLSFLPSYPNYEGSEAYGLNNMGDAVGRAYSSNRLPRALYWPAAGGVYGFSVGSTQTEFFGINDSREMLAWARQKASSPMGTNVVKFSGGKWKVYYLGPGVPQDINNAGKVISMNEGLAVPLFTPNGAHTSWTKQIIVSDGSAWDLNELGQVVGSFPTTGPRRPFVYLPTAQYGLQAGVNDLWDIVVAALPAPSVPDSVWRWGTATAINDHGVIFGYLSAAVFNGSHWVQAGQQLAWIWDPVNGTRLFEDLLVGTGWSLPPSVGNPSAGETQWTDEWSINNSGQIVCRASNDGGLTYELVLLTP